MYKHINVVIINMKIIFVLLMSISLLLPGCGGGERTEETEGTNTQTITGIVSAPGGTVAFNTPKFILRIFDVLFGETAQAAQTNLAVVAGVKVNLIEIDNTGAQVGIPIATATSEQDGTYTLKVRQNFVPSGKYVIRVAGSGSNQMSAFVTGNVANVSPVIDALYGLVLTSASANDGKVTGLATSTIVDLKDIVDELITSSEVELTGTTAKTISDALKDAASIDEESDSRLKHAFGKGKISGTVTGSSGKGCAGVTILIRDFGNIVTRYLTKTDSNVKWSVTVQHTGNYIIGAMNDSKDCADGSQWWASPSLVTKQLSAEKVTVAADQAMSKDFQLPAGGRIQGTVRAGNSGLPLAGITVKVRDFLNTQTVAFTKTKEDGSYVINLAPGSYFLTADNKTKQPYATETYSPSRSGGTSFFDADKLTVVAGTTQTANFSLQAGRMVSGLVSDPVAGPIAGMRVRFDDADDTEHADVHRTNLKGRYRIWLRPDTYLILSRGQRKLVDLTSANQIADFAESVGEIRMLIQDTAGNPISQAKPRFRARTAIGPDLTKFDVLSKEASNGDGTVSLYATNANKDNNWLEIKIDNGTAIGSSIYSGKNRLQDGDAIPVTIGGVNDLGTITLPAGGMLSGKVTVAGIPQPGVRVQVRNGGKGSGDRFTTTRTMSDGTYSLSLPVGTITRVCAFTGNQASNCPSSGAGTGKGSGNSFSYEFIDNLVITASANKTQDFSLP